MEEIEFSYKGTNTIILCNPNEKFSEILKRLSIKIEINLNSVYFLYSGNMIQNMEKTFIELANNFDKERKKMNIKINDIESSTEKVNTIIKSKQIICPKCKENCFIQIDNFKVRLYDCINGHDINEISLEDFEKTQKIDESKIICEICKNIDKGNSYEKKFFRCNICEKNLCPLCKDKHDKNHIIIDYEDKNYICRKHNYSYTLYCKSCKKNICIYCEVSHKNHEIISFGKIMVTKEILEKKSEDFLKITNKFINDMNKIINKLNLLKENINILYKIINDILTYDYKYKNYEMLQNINNDFCFKILEDINKKNDVNIRFKNLMDIYNNITEKKLPTLPKTQIKISMEPKDSKRRSCSNISRAKCNSNKYIANLLNKNQVKNDLNRFQNIIMTQSVENKKHFELTKDEYIFFNKIYKMLDNDNQGRIKGKEAANFMKTSGLEKGILKQIWLISVKKTNAQIEKEEFFEAMRLIALAQNNMPFSEENIEKNYPIPPLPKFNLNISVNNNFNNNQINKNESKNINTTYSIYNLSEKEKINYKNIFDNHKESNFERISAHNAILIWQDSNADDQTIIKVANLIKPLENKGFLNLKEFQVACHLINISEEIFLPEKLPLTLVNFLGRNVTKIDNNFLEKNY